MAPVRRLKTHSYATKPSRAINLTRLEATLNADGTDDVHQYDGDEQDDGPGKVNGYRTEPNGLDDAAREFERRIRKPDNDAQENEKHASGTPISAQRPTEINQETNPHADNEGHENVINHEEKNVQDHDKPFGADARRPPKNGSAGIRLTGITARC